MNKKSLFIACMAALVVIMIAIFKMEKSVPQEVIHFEKTEEVNFEKKKKNIQKPAKIKELSLDTPKKKTPRSITDQKISSKEKNNSQKRKLQKSIELLENDERGVQEYLQVLGINFPKGAKVAYLPGVSRLVMTNEKSEQKYFENILNDIQKGSELRVIPREDNKEQFIEFETKFYAVDEEMMLIIEKEVKRREKL